jgi:hypothetical protein
MIEEASVTGRRCSDIAKNLDHLFQDWNYKNGPTSRSLPDLERAYQMATFLQDVLREAMNKLEETNIDGAGGPSIV